MANTANFTTSVRKYTSCLGTVDFDLGNPPVHYRRAIVASFTETTVTTRALTSPSTDTVSLTMATYDFWHGGPTDGYTHVYFDYESRRVASECHRTSEAGFYTRTTVTTVCDGITVQ